LCYWGLPPRRIDTVRRVAVTLSHGRSAADGRAVYIARLSMAARSGAQRCRSKWWLAGPNAGRARARNARPKRLNVRQEDLTPIIMISRRAEPKGRSRVGAVRSRIVPDSTIHRNLSGMSQDSLVVVTSRASSVSRRHVLSRRDPSRQDMSQSRRQLQRSIQLYERTFIERSESNAVGKLAALFSDSFSSNGQVDDVCPLRESRDACRRRGAPIVNAPSSRSHA